MKTFADFINNTISESVVKRYNVRGTRVEIRKVSNSFDVYVDNEKLESLPSLEKAEIAVKDFSMLWAK
jgi:hypothetical protein